MTIHTYRVIYRYPNDDTEYAVTVDERSEEAAKAAVNQSCHQFMPVEPIIIVRVELVA